MWANNFEVQCPMPYGYVEILYAFVEVRLHDLNRINRIQTACYIFSLGIPQLSLNLGIRFVFSFFLKLETYNFRQLYGLGVGRELLTNGGKANTRCAFR